jgi:hypothetical protein
MNDANQGYPEDDDPHVRSSIVALLRLIEKRPALYIGQRYITSLAAFIDGWSFALRDQITDAHVFRDFDKWLRELYEVTSNRSWDQIVLFYSSDQYEALQNFFDLWHKYLKEANGSAADGTIGQPPKLP